MYKLVLANEETGDLTTFWIEDGAAFIKTNKGISKIKIHDGPHEYDIKNHFENIIEIMSIIRKEQIKDLAQEKKQ